MILLLRVQMKKHLKPCSVTLYVLKAFEMKFKDYWLTSTSNKYETIEAWKQMCVFQKQLPDNGPQNFKCRLVLQKWKLFFDFKIFLLFKNTLSSLASSPQRYTCDKEEYSTWKLKKKIFKRFLPSKISWQLKPNITYNI